MKRILLFLAILTFATGVKIGRAQQWSIDTTCLRIYFDEHRFPGFNALYNPDSVMIDTCKDSMMYRNQVWIHRGIRMELPIIPVLAPADSIVEVPWMALDTESYYSNYRVAFQKIYDSIGPYLLRKINPADTTATGWWYEFRFFSYTPVDLVYYYLHQVPGIVVRGAEPVVPGGQGKVEEFNTAQASMRVYPIPAHDLVHVVIPTGEEGSSLTVHDELGRVVDHIPVRWDGDSTYTLDFSNSPSAGLYFVQLGSHCARILLTK